MVKRGKEMKVRASFFFYEENMHTYTQKINLSAGLGMVACMKIPKISGEKKRLKSE